MNSLKAGIWNETEKIFSRKKAIFFLGFSVVLPVFACFFISRFQSSLGIAAAGSGDFPVLMLNLFTLLILPLILFMIASDLFAGEFADKSIRIVAVRPITRGKIFTAKLASLGIALLIYLGAALLSSVLCSLFLVEGGNGLYALPQSAMAYAAAYPPMLTLALAAALVSLFFKNSSGALAACLLLYILAKLAAFVVPQWAAYTPAAYTDSYLLWLGSRAAAGKIAGIYQFLAACCILFFTAGYYFFEKKEL